MHIHGGAHDHDGEASEDTMVAKIVAMCILFGASMTLGCLPIKLAQWFNWKNGGARNNVYVKMLLCFGGGVLMCSTFLHLLPEVSEHLEEIEDFPEVPLPVAQLLMCTGFFVMYLVEECVHHYLHRREKNNFKRDALRRSFSISRGQFTQAEEKGNSLEECHNKEHNHIDHSHVVVEDKTVVTIRGLLVVLALSIHELFEGLSVGLESSTGSVWYMLGAVSAHKLVIAFCIGVELVTSGMKTFLTVIYVFTFAVVSPLGIGIGIAVSERDHESTVLPSVILQGLASGTLLYVVFFEILSSDRKSGIRQYFAVLLGFVVMAGLTSIEAH